MLFSIYQFSIVRHLTPSGAKKKKNKTSKNWEVGSHELFHKTKKLLQMVSYDLWARNWKIVCHGIWNPRACPPMTRMTSQSLPASSASTVVIISHSIDLAGPATEKIPWLIALLSDFKL